MTDVAAPTDPASEFTDARDLQARLYREIGISAVAAALRFITQPDPDQQPVATGRAMPAFLEDEHRAA